VNVWGRRFLVVAGIVVLIFGGLLPGPFTVGALILAGVLFVVAGRSPEEHDTTPNLVDVNGVTWTRDSTGLPNRWSAETETWDVVDPAPPDVIRAFDRRSDASQKTADSSHAAPIAAFVIAALVGLGVWALLDPYANIPVVSQVVCSLKGASWHGGSTGLGVPPGCYDRTPEDGLNESESQVESDRRRSSSLLS
jgi:hypothetical protein